MTHITRLIFNSMSLCRKTFIVIFWDGSINVILHTLNSNRKHWFRIILDETFEYAFHKRTTFAMPTIDRKKRPQSKTQVSQSLLRVIQFILLFFLNYHETSVNRGLLLPYIPYFFLYTFCSNKRAQLGKCFHTSLIFLEKCFEYIIVFHDLTLIFKDNLILWDSSQIGARSAGKCFD